MELVHNRDLITQDSGIASQDTVHKCVEIYSISSDEESSAQEKPKPKTNHRITRMSKTSTPKSNNPKTGTPKTTPKTSMPKSNTPKTSTPKTSTPSTPNLGTLKDDAPNGSTLGLSTLKQSIRHETTPKNVTREKTAIQPSSSQAGFSPPQEQPITFTPVNPETKGVKRSMTERRHDHCDGTPASAKPLTTGEERSSSTSALMSSSPKASSLSGFLYRPNLLSKSPDQHTVGLGNDGVSHFDHLSSSEAESIELQRKSKRPKRTLDHSLEAGSKTFVRMTGPQVEAIKNTMTQMSKLLAVDQLPGKWKWRTSCAD